MQNFDYIELAEFRSSLQSDYAEMQNCVNASAWKSAQVLAGSIVECLLIDYLSVKYKEKPEGKDPLKIDLADAISTCRANGALTDRTADLCAVIRSYRNLIHPGRMIRLKEKSPDKASCNIAVSLIDMIVDDIATSRKEIVGLTAEQILSKINRDDQVIPILSHLLEDVREHQRLRLVLDLIPGAYENLWADEEGDQRIADRLMAAYRVVFDALPKHLKTQVVDHFATMLREGDGQTITNYRRAFINGSDTEYLSPQNVAIVKEHILNCIRPMIGIEDLDAVRGIGKILMPADASAWLSPFLTALVSSAVSEDHKRRLRQAFSLTSATTSSEFDEAVSEKVDSWIEYYKTTDKVRVLEVLESMRSELDIPF